MRKILVAASLAAVVVAVACVGRDRQSITGPSRSFNSGANLMGTCTTMGALQAQAATVFGSGSPNVNSVVGKLNNLAHQVQIGDAAAAAAQANNIVAFVQAKAADGRLAGTPAQIDLFLHGVLCYGGVDPNTFLVQPTDDPQVITANGTGGNNAGISLQGQTVGVPTLITITLLDPNGPSGLITKLDQYPTFINITSSSTLSKPSVVAICLGTNVPTSVFNRLRLGHQATFGFEITPAADPSFLNCPTQIASASRSKLPEWMKSLASLVMPKVLYARQDDFRSGGVGGSATEYSPFDAVDPDLRSAGGVGGSATEYQKKPTEPAKPGAPTTPGTKPTTGAAFLKATPAGGAATISTPSDGCSATVGTQLAPACNPVITITTPKGTAFVSVPVTWTVAAGGGSIAANTPAGCGTFGSTASTTTGPNGKAGICWQMGPTAATNTVTAAPSIGGDAPAGVIFDPPSLTFNAEGLRITPTATATGASVTFDGNDHPGSGTCSNGLTPVLTYDGNGSVPHNVGSYILTVSCGGGDVYNLVTATAPIVVGQFATTASVSCPASVVYTGAAQTPCSATVTGPGLSLTPTPTYTGNTDAGTATASVTYAGGGNYAAATGSQTFQITPAPTATALTCPASVVFNGSAETPCSAATTGPGGLNATDAVSYAANTNVGTASATAGYTATNNYQASSGSASFAITPAATVTTVTCPASVVYNGSAQTPCSANTTGPGGLSQASTPTYSANSDVGTATASATFAAGGNYQGSAGSATFQITLAPTTTAVTCPASVVYSGAAQTPCSATTTGAGGLSVSDAVSYAANSNAGTATATASFGGGGNYQASGGSATFQITPAATSAAVTCSPTSVVFTGSAQTPCSATVTGPGLSLTPAPSYANNVGAGTATAMVNYAGGGNWAGSSASATFQITPAPTTTTATCPASVVFNGSAESPCSATTTGAGGLSVSDAVSYASNTNVGTATANASFAAGGNYLGSSDSKSFQITPASTITAVSCPASVQYNGGAQAPCSANTTGPGGLNQSDAVSYGNNTNAGTASAGATFAAGGNYLGSSGAGSFQITRAGSTTSVSCPASVPYNGADQAPCSASVSGVGGLSQSVSVSYAPGAPHNAGAYSASASYSGDPNHTGSSGLGSVAVTQLAATATAGNGSMNFGAAVPALSCTVTGLLPVDAGAVTCSTPAPAITIAGTYATVPVVSPASPVNYSVASVNGTLNVAAYVQVGCFSSPIYSVMPDSKSAQKKGSNLPVKCTLTTPQGASVTTATGSISVIDAGIQASVPPVKTGPVVFTAPNAFRYSTAGNYAYGLDTSPASFIVGHYYYVVASWNDGSKTEGWFLLK